MQSPVDSNMTASLDDAKVISTEGALPKEKSG